MEVKRHEPKQSAKKSTREHGHEIVVPHQRRGNHDDCRKQGGPYGQPIESVNQVERIGDQQNPTDGQREAHKVSDGIAANREIQIVQSEPREIKERGGAEFEHELCLRPNGS